MIFVVDRGDRKHFAADLAAMHSQRKTAFVDRAGWTIPVIANQEIDQYDYLDDTRYLLAKSSARSPVLASARLISTTGPHLMRDLYPGYRPEIPSGPTVWEASRYCTAPEIRTRSKRLDLLWEIIAGVMETALEHAVHQVIFTANRALLPLAMRCGWEARVVGPTLTDGPDEVTAVAATVTPNGLRNLRKQRAVADPVIGTPSHRVPRDARINQTDCINTNAETRLTQSFLDRIPTR